MRQKPAKVMYTDFRKDPPPQTGTAIHDNKIAVVDEYTYLGIIDKTY